MISALGVLAATIGAAIAASDLLLGPELLSRTEGWLRRNLLPITFAEVHKSSPVGLMWSILAFPLKLWDPIRIRPADPRITHHAINRRRERPAIAAALKSAGSEGAFYFFGSSVEQWEQTVGEEGVRLSAYMHFYPRQEYDKAIAVGAPAPWEPTKYVTEIRMRAPGVIVVELGEEGEVPAENNYPVVAYAEALINYPLEPGHFVPLPQSPLFTPLCDEVQSRALSALSALSRKPPPFRPTRLAPITVEERRVRNLIPLMFDVGLWLAESMIGGALNIVRSVAAALYSPVYFVLALAFSVLSLIVAGPLFAVLLLLVIPLRACSSWAAHRNAQSFLRLFGVVLAALGGLLQLIA